MNALTVLYDPACPTCSRARFVDDNAWVVWLWALRDYRRVASLMTTPALRPMARRVITMVSERVAEQRAWRLN